MPFANFKIPQGMMTVAQKADLIHRTTDLLVSYFGEGARAHTMVLVDEVVDGGYGRADVVFDLEALRRMQARLEPRSR
jgi:4-oxalocrotonate tautomerase